MGLTHSAGCLCAKLWSACSQVLVQTYGDQPDAAAPSDT